MQGCWQLYIESSELHAFCIAVDRTFDAEWVVWILTDELLWQTADKACQVLLAQLGVEADVHLTRIQRVCDVEVDIGFSLHVAVGRAQNQVWNVNMPESRV